MSDQPISLDAVLPPGMAVKAEEVKIRQHQTRLNKFVGELQM